MNVKKIVGTATIAGALGTAAVGLGAGTAQADDLGAVGAVGAMGASCGRLG
jgi:hypothetical protein